MEIPVINRISDFEVLQNPSLLSQAFSLCKVSQAHYFWKWGALILAIVASFSTIINKIKTLIIRLQQHYASKASNSLLGFDDDWSDISDDENEEEEEDDDKCSSSSFSDSEEGESKSNFDNRNRTNDDFYNLGSSFSGCFRWKSPDFRRRSFVDFWSEFTSGKSVVKLWDNFGLQLDFDDENSEETAFSNDDFRADDDDEASSLLATSFSDNIVRVWDTRVGRRIPAMLAEWRRPEIGKIVGVSGEKVYLRGGEVTTVGDMRKLSSPLESFSTESEIWWDADSDEIGGVTRGCEKAKTA